MFTQVQTVRFDKDETMSTDKQKVIREFPIDFEYNGRRMAIVKEMDDFGKRYYDCILFRDNVLRIHHDGTKWLESLDDQETAIAKALGLGIKKYLLRTIGK